MPTTEHIAQFFIQIEGTHLEEELMNQLISVEVDDSLDLPDMFTVHLKDFGLKAIQGDTFQPGKKVKISVRMPFESSQNSSPPPTVPLIIGEITAMEPDLNGTDRATLIVRGYDKSHRMNRVRKNSTFLQMKDSDIASKLASANGLTAEVTATATVYPYLMQANQTDWEFLVGRARRIGYRLYVEDNKLYFKPPPQSPPETNLEWGITLDQFHARLSTVNQVNQVEVRGWDTTSKKAIVGTAGSPTASRQNGISQEGGPGAQQAHSIQGKAIVVDVPVVDQNDATKVAQALLDRLSAGYIEVEGQCAGNPNIQAGTKINITGVGSRYNGKYLITRALHHYSAKGGYKVKFWATGGTGPNTISSLLNGRTGHGPSHDSQARPTERGVMVGIVTNNKDDQQQGRVKVKFPTMGDNHESYWCRLASTMAGAGRGIAYLPEANDEVVVAFENGDPPRGVVLGAVWNGNDSLPMATSELVTGAITLRRAIKTRVGHQIVIDDTGDPGGFIIKDKTGNQQILINTQKQTIDILAQNDITIKSSAGKISISGQTGVDIQGNAGDVTVGTNMNFKVTASINAEISATAQAKMTGTAGVEVSSPATATFSGMASAELKSGGAVQVQGSAVSITGAGNVSIKGATVSLM
jgi:phage protein D